MEIVFQLSGALWNKVPILGYGRNKARRFEGSGLEELRQTACTLLGDFETLGVLQYRKLGMWCDLQSETDFASLCEEYKRSEPQPMDILVLFSSAENDVSTTGTAGIYTTPVKCTETRLVATPSAVDCSGNTSTKRPPSTSVVRKFNEDTLFLSQSCPSQMSIGLDELLTSDNKFDEKWYFPAQQIIETSPILWALKHNEANMENSQPVTEFQRDALDFQSFSDPNQERVGLISPSTSQPGRLPEVSFPQAYLPLQVYSDEVEDVDYEAVSVFLGMKNNFHSYFWTYGPLIHAYQAHLGRVVIIDGIPLRNTRGILMTALTVDPDNRTFPLAFAVADTENEANWRFFFRLLRKHVFKSRQLKVIQTCRHTLMTKLVSQYFQTDLHVYCPFHLYEIISRTSPEAAQKFKEASTELDEGTFSCRMVELQGFSETTHRNLLAIGYEKWADLHISRAGFTRFSSNTFNHVASWHAMILLFDNQTLPVFVQCVRTTIARHYQLYRARSARSPQDLCPTAGWMLQQQNRRSHGCRARRMVGRKCIVQSDHPGSPHIVDMDKSQCSCNFWQVHSIPCAHAIACLGTCRQQTLETLVSPYYSTQTLLGIYKERWVPTSSSKRVPIGLCCPHCLEARGYSKIHVHIASRFDQSLDEN